MNDTAGRAPMTASTKQSKSPIEIKTVGVIGAGQMGSGIAHVAAMAGFDVALCDISDEQLKRAIANIDKNMTRQVTKGAMKDADKAAALARIKTATGMDVMKDRDLVIEAATEDEETKKKIFKSVCPVLKPEAVLCSNTSSISITRLGAVSDRPERFMGLHFMNPVPVMKLVELIRGIATEEATFAGVKEFAVKLGKQTVSSEDFPAFIVNRVLIPMINEAIYTLYEGVGTVKAIDTALKLGANHPMGPLELADFIGLDTCLAIMSVLHDGLADTKYRPCPLLVKYVEAGWLGRKSGKGFYDYSGAEPIPTR
jgi:3-hydroxybutyryl-CoA dehydrogenase